MRATMPSTASAIAAACPATIPGTTLSPAFIALTSSAVVSSSRSPRSGSVDSVVRADNSSRSSSIRAGSFSTVDVPFVREVGPRGQVPRAVEGGTGGGDGLEPACGQRRDQLLGEPLVAGEPAEDGDGSGAGRRGGGGGRLGEVC